MRVYELKTHNKKRIKEQLTKKKIKNFDVVNYELVLIKLL